MKKVSDSMQPILDTICPPKKTIWVLLWKTDKSSRWNYDWSDRFECFWFNKPSAQQISELLCRSEQEYVNVLLRGETAFLGRVTYQLREIAEGEDL